MGATADSSPPQKAQAVSVSPETAEEHQSAEDDGASAEEEEDEEESDDEGWITPSNLKQVQQDTGHCDTAPVGVQVGCVTTDFAMQVGAGCSPARDWLQPQEHRGLAGWAEGRFSHYSKPLGWLNQHTDTEERVVKSPGQGETIL